ncbi:hypothetical protein Leryth_005335 [Lithospermum erythrorhizon]|nr:hypothetical protein Leryth_005335 [Lithospermum erythrorhizon]
MEKRYRSRDVEYLIPNPSVAWRIELMSLGEHLALKFLAIPEKFVKHFGEKLGKLVYLKIPSGAKWHVGLVVDRGALCLKLGWREFMEENSLQKGDILMLKYSGSMGFDVLLFDRHSLCEKEVSYFITKCEHTTTNKTTGQGKRKDQETAKETSDRRTREHPPESSVDALDHNEESFRVRSVSSDDGTDWTPTKRTKKEDIITPNPGRRLRANGKIQEIDNNLTPLVPYQTQIGGTLEVGTEEDNIVEMTPIRRRPLEFISNRRPISKEEKYNVELMAEKEITESGVVVIMKEFQVYRDFFLTIPSWWVQENLPPENVEVCLQVGTKKWKMNYMKRTIGGMLRTGWKKFALDNCLEEYDACLFKVVDAESNPILIDVKIFRVVDEVVPPTPLKLALTRRRGRRPLAKSRRKWK